MKKFLWVIFFCMLLIPVLPALSTAADISVSLTARTPGFTRKVHISWTAPETEPGAPAVSEYLLYRDTRQILRTSLASLTPIARIPADFTAYTDDPAADVPDAEPGTAWYYAVLLFYANGTAGNVVIPAVNASVSGAVPVPSEAPPVAQIIQRRPKPASYDSRSLIPLPFLNMAGSEQNAERLPLSAEAEQYAESVKPARAMQKPVQQRHIFAEETESGVTGERYLLAQIISTSFSAGDWITAETDLKKFLQINRSTGVTRRAKFYLGEVLYYQGYFREALNAFIDAENSFPALTKQWIQAVLDRMPETGR